MRPVRHAALAVAAVAVALAGACDAAVLVRDPGHLEIHNWLREDLVALVGGRQQRVPACSVVELDDVELRGVRVLSGSGVDLLRLDRPDAPPIGPQRFVVVGGGSGIPVADLRTRPIGGGGPECSMTLEELLRGMPGRGERRLGPLP